MNKTNLKKNFYLGLVHFPVYNKFNQIITTSITHIDIHDIARSCLTFGIKKFFIINPLKTQELFLRRILKFWNSEIARYYNYHRCSALSIIEYTQNISNAINEIKKQEGDDLITITTTATKHNNQLDYLDFRRFKKPVFLLFGTGNGLTSEIHKHADYVLKPIEGVNEYNHLSVRSAVAIVLDRLTSEK